MIYQYLIKYKQFIFTKNNTSNLFSQEYVNVNKPGLILTNGST